MVFPGHIAGGVEVSVDFVAAGLALKDRLRRPIVPIYVPALVAALTRLPGIDGIHHSARRFSLVCSEASKLRVAPRVVPSSLLASSLFRAGADLGQVLDHNHASRSCALDHLLGENVVAIAPKPSPSARHLLEVPLGRLRAFGLQLAIEPEVPVFNLLAVFISEKFRLRCHGRAVDPKINPNDPTGRNKFGWRDIHHQMQPPSAWPTQEIGSGEAGRLIKPPFGLSVRHERQLYASGHGGKANNAAVLLDRR
jgi:hypothetical protein